MSQDTVVVSLSVDVSKQAINDAAVNKSPIAFNFMWKFLRCVHQ